MKWRFAWVACLAVACTRNTVAPVPVQSLSTQSMVLDQIHASKTLYIRNTGHAALPWSLLFSDNYLSADVTGGSINPGDSAAINITANLKNIPAGTLVTTQAHVVFPENFDQYITVSVINFTETKWRLPGVIIDAVYNRQKDVILALASGSSNLLVINPEDRSIKTVALDFPGTSLSVSRDGSHAVVVRNAAFSYIDLNTLTVQKTVGLPLNAAHAVVTDTMVYALPGGSDWGSMIGVNLKNGDQINSYFSVSSGSVGKIHPSGNYMYVIPTQSSGAFVNQFNLQLQAGLSQENTFSSYSYPLGNNFWFSEDGLTYYAGTGNVFKVDNSQTVFLSYQTKLTGISYGINGLDYSAAAQRIYVVPSATYNDFAPVKQLLRYDLSHQLLGIETLEPFVQTDQYGITALYDAFGSYVFINSSGTHVYVLQKPNSPLAEVWALQTFDVK